MKIGERVIALFQLPPGLVPTGLRQFGVGARLNWRSRQFVEGSKPVKSFKVLV